MSQLAVGDILDGRYRIDHPIARGGMSTVYRCIDLRLGRAVAVKVMHERYVDDPVSRDRFSREARAMAQLSHPNIVDVYDFSAGNEHVFLVMELITGGTLRELLAERGPMPPYAATAVMRAVLTGLSVAHARGMVHRDIKPDNVLINEDSRVKLGDFGLVRASSGAATTDKIVGTVAYLSPEQVENTTITPTSDVYSAGIVLFELLTGQTPFSGDTDFTHALARVTNDVPAPSSLIDGVPPLFDQLVATATMRDPDERFTDAGEFLAALDDVAAELQLPAFTVPAPTNSAAHRAAAVPTNTTVLGGDDDAGTEHLSYTSPAPPETAQHTRVMGDTDDDLPEQELVPATASAPESDLEQLDKAGIAGTEPPEKPVSNRSPWRLAVWLVIIAVLTAAVAIGGWWFGSGRYGEIPQIIGMDRVTAIATVEEAGFNTDTEIIYHDDVPPDMPAGTDPPEGGRLLPGETVTILISQGKPTVPQIPAGIGVEDYRALAAERTLEVETGESIYSSDVPAGTVAVTDPAPGSAVPIGSTVTVQISQGPEPATVPDIEGQPLAVARDMLAEAGLNVGDTTEEFDDVIYGGNVISADPGPGTTLERGDRVDLVLSTAVRIPHLIGVDVEEAAEQLEDLDIAVSTKISDAQVGESFDTVIGMEPDPDAGVLFDPDEDMSVILLLPKEIRTPNVVGMTVEEARSELADAGLRIGASRRNDDKVITQQSPAAGEPAEKRDRISVTVED